MINGRNDEGIMRIVCRRVEVFAFSVKKKRHPFTCRYARQRKDGGEL
jgi:hypothetical protein